MCSVMPWCTHCPSVNKNDKVLAQRMHSMGTCETSWCSVSTNLVNAITAEAASAAMATVRMCSAVTFVKNSFALTAALSLAGRVRTICAASVKKAGRYKQKRINGL
jgi:hypothetical protein